MLEIKRLSPSDVATAGRWDAFVFSCPQATFFHRAAWQSVIGSVFRHDTYFLYAEREGRIEGVLPLAHVRSLLFGNALLLLLDPAEPGVRQVYGKESEYDRDARDHGVAPVHCLTPLSRSPG